ncbi:MAG: hypothetical protein KKC05_00205 [Nanoarchaeota archaeon]|nr:hypothetical protein [Nanoarchaeota archaeon]
MGFWFWNNVGSGEEDDSTIEVNADFLPPGFEPPITTEQPVIEPNSQQPSKYAHDGPFFPDLE